MKILNCESTQSMYDSIKTITGISIKNIETFFDEFDLDSSYKSLPCDKLEESEKILFKKFKIKFNPSKKIDMVYWFHATRTFDEKNFNKGILPLGKIIDDIWGSLYELIKNNFSKVKWAQFRKKLDSGSKRKIPPTYYQRVKEKISEGPDAYLIRDIAFKARNIPILHDYFDTSEIIEDICISFEQQYKINLLKMYKQNTKKCIVTFKSSEYTNLDFLKIALLYLYKNHKNMEIGSEFALCYPGGGSIIPKEQIINIDIVE